MINFRSWDKLRNNFIIKLTGKPNPFKEDTLEASLINFIVSIHGQIINDAEKYTQLLVDYLVKEKIRANLDPWCLHDYFKKALWLAQFNDIVYLTQAEKNETLQFGIFLESAMVNMLRDPNFANHLNKVQNPERKLALNQVLHIADNFYTMFRLPTYHVDYGSGTITIKNMAEEFFQKIESLPIQTYNFPYSPWVDVETRGYFHHLGDELAFIMAAMYHGDCYILGNDEFGDLQVLNIIQHEWKYTKFRIGEKVSFRDLDYVYGLPRTNAMYPSSKNNTFNYSEDLANSKLNNQENANFTGAYWQNDVFKKYAKRPLEELTMKELIQKVDNSFEKVVKASSNEIQAIYKNIFSYQKMIKQAFILKQNLHERFADEIKLNDVETLKKFKKASKNIIKFMSIQIKTVLNIQHTEKEYHIFNLINDIFVLLKKRTTMLLTTIELEEFISYTIKQIKSILPKENIDTLLILEELNKNLKNLLPLFILQNKSLNEEIRQELSFFYKTVAHKVHCEIINPKSDKELGFFLKDKTDVRHYLDLNSFVTFLFSEEHLHNIENMDLFSLFVMNNLANTKNQDKSYKTLLKYWYKTDMKAFVVSPIVDMQNEYRMFVINGRVAAASPCFRNSTPFDAWDNGRFDARLCHGHSAYETFVNRERVAKYAKFARKFTKEMKNLHPNITSYVLDVAWNEDLNDVIAIEVNTVSFSGAYQIDFRRVCSAIANKPFYYSEINKKYWANWELLKQNAQKVIEEEVEINTDATQKKKIITLFRKE